MTLNRTEATVIEGSTPTYSALIEKAAIIGTEITHRPLLLEEINTITLDYVNDADSSAINSRSSQNVKNANNVIIKSRGELFWTLQTGDTVIVDSTLSSGEMEAHTATFKVITTFGTVMYKMVSIWVKKR